MLRCFPTVRGIRRRRSTSFAALRLPVSARTATPTARRSLVEDTREGVRYAASDHPTRVALTAATGASLVIAVMSVLGVVVAHDTLGLSVSGYGLMMSSMGVGMLLAALTLGRRRSGHPHDRTRFGLAGLLLAGIGLGILPWFHTLGPALLCSAVIGAGVLAVQISTQTTLQSALPDLRGRVLSLGQSVTGIAQVLAIALTAALTGPLGAFWVLCGTGILTAATAFALLTPRTESRIA